MSPFTLLRLLQHVFLQRSVPALFSTPSKCTRSRAGFFPASFVRGAPVAPGGRDELPLTCASLAIRLLFVFQVTEEGGVVISGRSDAVLNPGGVRIGTAEIYRQARFAIVCLWFLICSFLVKGLELRFGLELWLDVLCCRFVSVCLVQSFASFALRFVPSLCDCCFAAGAGTSAAAAAAASDFSSLDGRVMNSQVLTVELSERRYTSRCCVWPDFSGKLSAMKIIQVPPRPNHRPTPPELSLDPAAGGDGTGGRRLRCGRAPRGRGRGGGAIRQAGAD